MTFHPRSVVEFGQLITGVAEGLVGGRPTHQVLDDVRAHFAAEVATLSVDDRLVVAGPPARDETDGPADLEADEARQRRVRERVAELAEHAHQVTASVHGEDRRVTLRLFRRRSASAFDAETGAACEIIAGQFLRGLALSQQLLASELERRLYSGVMDRLSVGVVILGASGRVLRCSEKAAEVLAQRDGLQLQAGRVRATSASEDRALQQVIQGAMQASALGQAAGPRGLSLTKHSGHRTLGVIVQPVTRGEHATASEASVAVYVRDPEANADVQSELVCQLFDLTPAEAAVARRLAAGLSLEDTAQSLDISRNTARAHLRSIFSKSGITRQTELVRLMLNSAAVLGERLRGVA